MQLFVLSRFQCHCSFEVQRRLRYGPANLGSAVDAVEDSTTWIFSTDLLIWVFPKVPSTPKSSILIGFSIINHPFGDTPIFGNTHLLRTKHLEILNQRYFNKKCCLKMVMNLTVDPIQNQTTMLSHFHASKKTWLRQTKTSSALSQGNKQ